MKTLKIDGKWSVKYDPANNDLCDDCCDDMEIER